VTNFHAGSVLRSQIMDFQMHEIGTAIRPLFVDLAGVATFTYNIIFEICHSMRLVQ